MIKYGLLVLGAYVCVASDSACTLQHDPVCGTDGKTYSNNCFLALKMAKNPQLQLKYKGPCQKHDRRIRSVLCPTEIENVCGSDGATYRNPCILNLANTATNKVKLLHYGACNNKSIETIVNQTHKEIKNKFTKSHKSEHIQSLLKNKTQSKPETKNVNNNITKETVQKKPVETRNANKIVPNENPTIELSCPCGLELEEICGNNGVTYDNPCLLQCAAKVNNTLEIHFEGRCNGSELIVVARKPRSIEINNDIKVKYNVNGNSEQESEEDDDELLCGCGRNYLAVCGTNGVSYNNPCLLECAAKKNKSIEIKYLGRCDGKDAFGRDKPNLDIAINGEKYFEDDDDIFGRDLMPEIARKLKREIEKAIESKHAENNTKKITKRHAKFVTFRY